jgi:hypothetical protein
MNQPNNDYQQRMGHHDPGQWFIVEKKLCKIMSDSEAMVFSCLCNKYNIDERYGKLKDNWFECSMDDIYNELYKPLRTQERIIQSLKTLGFIETKQIGNPAKRWIYIHIEVVDEKLGLPKSGLPELASLGVARTGKPIPYKKELNKNSESSLKTKQKPIPPWAVGHATQLANMLFANGSMNHNSKISSWARSFYEIHSIGKRPIPEIRTRLDWFCKMWPKWKKHQYLPKIQSGETFKEKWDKLETAMNNPLFKESDDTKEEFVEKYPFFLNSKPNICKNEADED